MPIWLFPALLAIGAVTTLVSGIWLGLHLTAVARTFAGNADLVPAPVPARASARQVHLWLGLFLVGTMISLGVIVMILLGFAANTNVPG